MTLPTIYVDTPLYAQLQQHGQHGGLNHIEQGGILLGRASLWGIYVQELTTPGPLDIQTEGMILLADPKHEQRLNDSGLSYLGFWHTHPPGTPSDPSAEDLSSWHDIAVVMFDQQPSVPTLLFPIVTGDRTRLWRVDRTPNLHHMPLTEVRPSTPATPS